MLSVTGPSRSVYKGHTASILLLLIAPSVWGKAEFSDYVSFSLGMVNVSFTETESMLKSDDDDEPAEGANTGPGAGAASVMSLEMGYHRPWSEKKEIFGKFILPFQSAAGNALVYGGGGMNYFFSGQGAYLKGDFSEASVRIAPKLRYYAGGQLGLGYLIYTTQTAKKTDILFDLGAHGGMLYHWKDRWSWRAEVGMGRGVGTNVSASMMRMFFGTAFSF